MDVIVHEALVFFMIGNTPYEAPYSDTWTITNQSVLESIHPHLENVHDDDDFTFPYVPNRNNIETTWKTAMQKSSTWIDEGNVPCLPLTEYGVDEDDIVDVSEWFRLSNMETALYYCIPTFVGMRQELREQYYNHFKFEEFQDRTPYHEGHINAANKIAQHVFFNPKSMLTRRALARDMKTVQLVELLNPPPYALNYP